MKEFYIVVISAIVLFGVLQLLLKKIWPIKTYAYQAGRILLEKDPELHALMKEISDGSYFPLEAVIYTHYALVKNQSGDGVNSPDRTCENFLELFENLYTKSEHKGIMALRITSSKDLGIIVFDLAEKGIIQLPTSTKFEDFEDQFQKEG
jgi:hypothetical protein